MLYGFHYAQYKISQIAQRQVQNDGEKENGHGAAGQKNGLSGGTVRRLHLLSVQQYGRHLYDTGPGGGVHRVHQPQRGAGAGRL